MIFKKITCKFLFAIIRMSIVINYTQNYNNKKKYSKEFKQKIIKEVDFCLAGTEKIQQN